MKPSLEMNDTLTDFFFKNKDLVEKSYKEYMETLKTYRENIKFVYFDDKTNCLSYEFTFKIYNDISLSKEALKELFLKEKNQNIQNIGKDMDNNPKISNLFGYMNLMEKSMDQCWWVLFWYDMWILNKYFKGYAQPAQYRNISKFNVFLSDNIAENYELYQDKKELTRLLNSEEKMKFFKKRKLFDNIFVMIEKMKAKQLILDKMASMTEEERNLYFNDDGEFGATISRQNSSLLKRFTSKLKMKTRDLDENTSPRSRDLATPLSINIRPVPQNEPRTPLERQRLLETEQNNNTNQKETLSPLSPQDLNDIENLIREQNDQILEVDEEEKKE